MPDWSLRPAVPGDYPSILAIANQTALQTRSLDEFLLLEEGRNKRDPWLRLVATRSSGEVIGHGLLYRNLWRPKGTYWVGGAVEGAHRRMGVGSALMAALEQQAREWGQGTLESETRDDRPEGQQFLEAHGFARADHLFRSELKLSAFDPAPFRPALDRAEAGGYRFISLADLDLTDGMRRIYDLDIDATRDEPTIAPDWQPPSFAEYQQEFFGGEPFDPAGVLLAEKDGLLVGMSGLRFPPEKDTAWTYFTGVRREHRGRGLAQALKLLTLEYARKRGYAKVGTGNHERNTPMLAINRKFGFKPLPGVYHYRRRLSS